MTVREKTVSTPAFYGWGIIRDHSTEKRNGGKIVQEVDKGKYEQNVLAPAQIAMLRKAAETYDIATGGKNDVELIIYERGEE